MSTNYTFGEGKFRWTINDSYIEKGVPSRLLGMKDQLDWIKKQIEYFMFAEKFKLRYDLKKGEIYEIDFGLNVNTEFCNRHYGVVIKDSCEFDPLVVICPLKTNHKGPHPRSDIDIGYVDDLKSGHSSLAVINQIRPIDKLRIFTRHRIGYDDGLALAEAENRELIDRIPRLNEEQLQLILNAYCNYIFGEDNDKK